MMKMTINESHFPKILMKIGGEQTEGRNFFDFFLLEKEFKEVIPKICRRQSGLLDYETAHIHLLGNPSKTRNLSSEFIRKMDEGCFIVGSKAFTENLLDEHNLPERKINFTSRMFGFRN